MEMLQYKYITDNKGQQVCKYVQEIFDILTKWYDKMQDGTQILAIPDPFGIKVGIRRANQIVKDIDEDFQDHEHWRLKNPDTFNIGEDDLTKMPEFSRLCPNARLAMAQEILTKLDYIKNHQEEYLEEVKETKDYITEELYS